VGRVDDRILGSSPERRDSDGDRDGSPERRDGDVGGDESGDDTGSGCDGYPPMYGSVL